MSSANYDPSVSPRGHELDQLQPKLDQSVDNAVI